MKPCNASNKNERSSCCFRKNRGFHEHYRPELPTTTSVVPSHPLPSLRRPRPSNLLFNCKKGDTRPLFMHSVIDSKNHLFGKLKTCLCTQLERQRRPKIQSAFRVSGKGSVIRKSFVHNLGYLFKFQPIHFDEVSLS